jgi:hypothetical protein
MCGLVVCLATVVVGIDAGWQPLDEGGIEYLIQIEPQLLDALRSGETADFLRSEIPSHVRDVRAFRISVGNGELPHQLPTSKPEVPTGEPLVVAPPADVKPIAEQQAAFVQETGARPKTAAEGDTEAKPQSSQKPDQSDRPWLVLTMTVFALATSLGGNIFLGWLTCDARRRCRKLLGPSSAASDEQ